MAFFKTWNIFIEFIEILNQTAMLETMLSDILKKQYKTEIIF